MLFWGCLCLYGVRKQGQYWAEGVQCWFDDNRENDSLHNHVNTRAELVDYDFDLARLCKEVFGDREWRYKKPLKRQPEGRTHLQDVDFENLPKFQWKEEPIPAKPIAQIDTPFGTIEIELDYKQAPITVENFLTYAHEGHYSDGAFYRDLERNRSSSEGGKLPVILAKANPGLQSYPDPIELESTKQTGLTHVDGTISMWRDKDSSSARHHFFICIGDHPEYDFGGNSTTDRKGYAAFGKVTKGMEIAKKISDSLTAADSVSPQIKIQRIVRGN